MGWHYPSPASVLTACLALSQCATSTDPEEPGRWCQEEATRGDDYQGIMNTTSSGLTCQMWSATEPHSHGNTAVGDHNYCRNPGGRKEGVYCFTMDPNTRWQYCPVPLCGTGKEGMEP